MKGINVKVTAGIGAVVIAAAVGAFFLLNPTGSASAGDGSQKVTITMDDRLFDVTDITAKAGQPITVELVNHDTMNHQFEVPALNIKSDVVRPGKSVTVTFTPDKAGEYDFICPMTGHVAMGMYGTLHVVP